MKGTHTEQERPQRQNAKQLGWGIVGRGQSNVCSGQFTLQHLGSGLNDTLCAKYHFFKSSLGKILSRKAIRKGDA